MNIVESDKKKVVVCGDIHGEFETLVYNLKINNITDSLIIVVLAFIRRAIMICYIND